MVVRQNNNSLPIVVEPIEAQNLIRLPIVVEPVEARNIDPPIEVEKFFPDMQKIFRTYQNFSRKYKNFSTYIIIFLKILKFFQTYHNFSENTSMNPIILADISLTFSWSRACA
jgi:hypothetical protein